MTIYQATENGPVVCLMGENRAYAIGDTAYRFSREKYGQTLPMFAGGTAVTWINGKWTASPTARNIVRNWTNNVTIIN